MSRQQIIYQARSADFLAGGRPGSWYQQAGVDVLLLDAPSLLESVWVDDFEKHLQQLTERAAPLPVWLSLATTRHLHDAADNRETLFPWDDDRAWGDYIGRLKILSHFTLSYPVQGVLFDSEFYGLKSPLQDPKFAWRSGPASLIARRAREVVDALRSRYSELVLGHHVLHYLEKGLDGYGPFWKTAFARMAETGAPGLTLYGDGFYRAPGDFGQMQRQIKAYYGGAAVPGWMPAENGRWPRKPKKVIDLLSGQTACTDALRRFGRLWIFANGDLLSGPEADQWAGVFRSLKGGM